MAKKIKTFIKLTIPAGAARLPSPGAQAWKENYGGKE